MKTLIDGKNNIPKNDSEFFDIKKSSLWDYSIEINIDIREDIDLFNLFMIIKSYILSYEILCWKICVCWKETNTKLIVIETLSINKFKKMDYDSFMEWYEWRINTGLNRSSQQKRMDDVMCILLVLDKSFINFKKIDLNNLKPIYPWKEEMLKKFIKENSRDYYINKIKNLEKRIKELEVTLIDKRK